MRQTYKENQHKTIYGINLRPTSDPLTHVVSYLALEEIGVTIDATAEIVVVIVATTGIMVFVFFRLAGLIFEAAAAAVAEGASTGSDAEELDAAAAEERSAALLDRFWTTVDNFVLVIEEVTVLLGGTETETETAAAATKEANAEGVEGRGRDADEGEEVVGSGGGETDGVSPSAASIEALEAAEAVGAIPLPPPAPLNGTLGGDPTAVAVSIACCIFAASACCSKSAAEESVNSRCESSCV